MGERLRQLLEAAIQSLEDASCDYALVGGIAMNLRGRLRATRDLDVVVSPELDVSRLKESARRLGFAHHDRADRHQLDGVTLLRFWLPIEGLDQSMAFDVQQGHTEFHTQVIERAQRLALHHRPVRAATPEDLVLLKLLAYRPIDRADAVEMVQISDELDLDYLERWAQALEIEERLREILEV